MQRLAELILDEITARIDTLSPQQTRELVIALQDKYVRGAGLQTCPSAEPTTTNQLSESTSLSAKLPLKAGSELQFTSLSSAPSLDSAMQLTEMSATSRSRPKSVPTTTRKGDINAIVDDAKDVTAIATPEISATHVAIVDEAKEVTAIKTPKIASAAPAIVDETPDVGEIKAAKIVSTAGPIAESTAAPLAGISVPSARTSALRPAHVVQPTADVDDVIEAELIAVDGDEDAIIIMDVDDRIRR